MMYRFLPGKKLPVLINNRIHQCGNIKSDRREIIDSALPEWMALVGTEDSWNTMCEYIIYGQYVRFC